LIRKAASSIVTGWLPRSYKSDFGARVKEDAVPYAAIEDGIRLYYELTGPEDGPVVLQLGGGLFGRHSFGVVNDGFRECGFRLLSFDARG